MITKLSHKAYCCRDSEETRRFYEGFLGLPLADVREVLDMKTGCPVRQLHTSYRLNDGSLLAFVETPERPFTFVPQHEHDIHIALEVERAVLEALPAKSKLAGIEARKGVAPGSTDCLYFLDPNGYAIELCARHSEHPPRVTPVENGCRKTLTAWTAGKTLTKRGSGSLSARPRRS